MNREPQQQNQNYKQIKTDLEKSCVIFSSQIGQHLRIVSAIFYLLTILFFIVKFQCQII